MAERAMSTILKEIAEIKEDRQALFRELLGPGQLQRRRSVASLELERQHAHVHEIAAMNPFEGLGDHGFDAQQQRAFGGPVT